MFFQECGKSVISVGPWGGHGGHSWDDGAYSTIRQLEVVHGAGIDSIKVQYDKNGNPEWSEKRGGTGGSKVDKVKLDCPDEYLTSIHGTYGSLLEGGAIFVQSLTFQSNKRTFGPYGSQRGTFFSLPITQGKIVGFHGKSGWYLDAIGVHLEPLSKSNPSNAITYTQRSVVYGQEKYEYSMIQGNLGKDYDLIVAVRQKENNSNIPDSFSKKPGNSLSEYFSGKSHNSSPSRTESKDKIKDVVPATIERIPSKLVQGVMTYGSWGGNGGTEFDDGIYDGIRQIYLSRHVAIASIRVCYDQRGQPVWGGKNGGSGGYKYDKIIFNYPVETLTHITGYYGQAMGLGPNVIKSLTFHTTKGKYGPYGEELGHPFSTKLREGMIVGIHGRKGMVLDAIGVHVIEGKVTPPTSITPSNPINQDLVPTSEAGSPLLSFKLGKKGLTEEAVQKIVKDPLPYGPGPWGGDGGKPWDDGVFSGIKQIILTRTDAICSIEIEYDRNGQSVWSVKHGGNITGAAANGIKLNHPDEVLICISGYCGPLQKDQMTKVIKSLTFHTSRRKIGPFGEELGTFFTSATTEGKVVGFHGRSGMYLDAIGVHMQHWLGNQRSSKPSSLMKMFH